MHSVSVLKKINLLHNFVFNSKCLGAFVKKKNYNCE